MAKKKPTSRTDAVRQAVDQAFQTQIPRERISELLDELGSTAGQLRDADVPQRFEFEDVDLVVNIRAAREGEDGCLYWEWSDDVDWKSKVQMKMSAETANKYFQGKENVPVAIARRRIKTGGDIKSA